MSANAAPLRALREMFGMTNAEAHLAQAIQTGTPVSRFARVHGTSINTVYTHLRRIKEKTGCGRMVQLVSKLNELHFRCATVSNSRTLGQRGVTPARHNPQSRTTMRHNGRNTHGLCRWIYRCRTEEKS